MHEHGLMQAIVRQILQLADGPVVAATLTAGQMDCSDHEHLIEHFRIAARGTPLESIRISIQPAEGLGVRLQSIEVAE